MSVIGWNSVIVWQKLWWTHQTCRCPVCWIIIVEVWITTALEQMDVGPEIMRNCCVPGKLPGKEFPVVLQIS